MPQSMDAELVKKLQARRKTVDTEGSVLESRPEKPTADACGEWLLADALAEDWELLGDSQGDTAEEAAPPNAEQLQVILTRLRRLNREDGHALLKSLPAATRRALQLQLEGGVPVMPSEKPTLPPEQLEPAHAPGTTFERRIGKIGPSPPANADTTGTVTAPGAGGSTDASEDATSPVEGLSADELAERKKVERQRIEKERAACAAECASRWPLMLLEEKKSSANATESAGDAASAEAASKDASTEDGKVQEMADEELRVLRADIHRTRGSDPAFQDPAMHQRLETLLTGFCNQESIKYMQGLHEVAATFAFVQAMAPVDAAFDEATALACLTAFVHRYTPYFHDGESFVALHVSLLFFRQLILYHHPDLHNFLAESGVSPFLYATPWFITLFAAKTPMSVLLKLWDRYMARGNASFLPFLAVAALAAEKREILAVDREDAHAVVLRVGIRTPERLDAVWEAAETLQARTPRSLGLRLARVLAAVREKCPRAMSAATERPWSERVLERVEKERRFLVLAEEVAVQLARDAAAAAAAGESKNAAAAAAAQQKQQRLPILLLDVRSPEEYAQENLPQALHFQPPCLRRLVVAFKRGGRSHLDRLAVALSSAGSSFGSLFGASTSGSGGGAHAAAAEHHQQMLGTGGLPPARAPWAEPGLLDEVFAELQTAACDRWGDAWVSESACFHLVLLGGAQDTADTAGANGDSGSGAVAPLYEALTEHLALARVSVALGGAAAVHKEAAKRKLELTSTPLATVLAVTGSIKGQEPTGDATTANSSLLGSAWSKLQAASEALPPRDAVGGRFEGFMKSSREAARNLAEKAAERQQEIAAAVRQQAPELAAAARQRASAALQHIEKLSKDEENSEGLKARTWACQAWACDVDLGAGAPSRTAAVPKGDSEAAGEEPTTPDIGQIGLLPASLHLNNDGDLCLMESAALAGASGSAVLCYFEAARLRRIGSTPSKADVLSFFFPHSAQRKPGQESQQDETETPEDEKRPLLVARFSSAERARACAKAVAGVAAAAKRRAKAAAAESSTEAAGGYPPAPADKGATESISTQGNEAEAEKATAAPEPTLVADTSSTANATSETPAVENEKLESAADIDQDAEEFLRELDELANLP